MDEHEAKHGEKTIALTVYLFTDEIATEKGQYCTETRLDKRGLSRSEAIAHMA